MGYREMLETPAAVVLTANGCIRTNGDSQNFRHLNLFSGAPKFRNEFLWKQSIFMRVNKHISLFTMLFLLPVLLGAQQYEEFVLSGVYNGKNLYVQNPLAGNLKEYCTREVWVNDTKVFTNPRTSAYTVNLSHLSGNSPVTVRIVYSQGCVPKIINPQVIRTLNKFRYLSIHADSAKLEWVTTGELSSGKFFVEKWESNQWQPVLSLEARGVESSRYVAAIQHKGGQNRYRIKYLQNDGETFYSSVQKYEAAAEPLSFAPTRVSDKIYFTRETSYKVKDPKGNEVAKGYGKEVNLGHLNSGLYYLTYGDRKGKFYKK